MSARSSGTVYGPQNVTANGQTIGPVDTSDYEYVAIQFGSGSLVGTVTFEQSIDGTNWVTSPLQTLSATNSNQQGSPVNPAASSIWFGPCPGRYFRVRSTAYTSGSTSVSILPVQGGVPMAAYANSSTGATTPADGQANPTTAVIDEAFNMAYNGTTWDRTRNASGAQSGNDSSKALHVGSGTHAISSLTAASTVVAGTAVDGRILRAKHSLQITVIGVGATVVLEGSLDNVNWFQLPLVAPTGGGGTVTANAATTTGLYTVTQDVPVRSVRANQTSITSGTTTAFVGSAT